MEHLVSRRIALAEFSHSLTAGPYSGAGGLVHPVQVQRVRSTGPICGRKWLLSAMLL
jgi:hypothetical protein